jgi:hypothetical protein
MEMPKEDFLKIMDKDNEADSEEDVLYYKLEKITGLFSIDYDGHFGPAIYYSIFAEHDNGKTANIVEKTVKDHIKAVRG